jgi:hypothetical protein
MMSKKRIISSSMIDPIIDLCCGQPGEMADMIEKGGKS